MGMFDYFGMIDIYGNKMEIQCKAFGCSLAFFKLGDELGSLHGKKTYTIFADIYNIFILVKNGIFVGLTDDISETWSPYFGYYGDKIKKSTIINYLGQNDESIEIYDRHT